MLKEHWLENWLNKSKLTVFFQRKTNSSKKNHF